MDAIRSAALTAVAEVQATHEEQASVIRATKIVRDKTGCDLHTAIGAVKWAIDRPSAATLPAGTVVATETEVFIRSASNVRDTHPWLGTDYSATDEDIDELVLSEQATILRVGAS